MARALREPTAPLRTRLFIPAADASTIQWIENQENVSVSLRTVIHEVIERCGYGDVFNRQVEQQPRRGRPPGDASGQIRPVQSSDDDRESTPAVQIQLEPESEQVKINEQAPEPAFAAERPARVATPAPAPAPRAAVDKPVRREPSAVDDGRTNDAIMDLLA